MSKAQAPVAPPTTSEVRVGVHDGAAAVTYGGPEIIIAAGPCSVEGPDMIHDTATAVQRAGARVLRGGAFKPRTSPHAFQGLGADGLALLASARRLTGLPVVTEVMDVRHLELVADHADMLQIGARNMYNTPLLSAVGELRLPVLLKRSFAATVHELLSAAEYIAMRGNTGILFCERGIRTFETSTRSTLDVGAIPVLKRETGFPVIVDPSHAAGHASLVPSLALAAVAAGADGLLIEVHPDPSRALSDGLQSMHPGAFAALMSAIRPVAEAIGRSVAPPMALTLHARPRSSRRRHELRAGTGD
jgi:3-deoxy-7-phosphoheptulonate synthase